VTFDVAAFYIITPIADKHAAVSAHREFLAAHNVVGRVYIWDDGLNAQVSGASINVGAYVAWCEAAYPEDFHVKLDKVVEPAFPRLRVKAKRLAPLVRGRDVNLRLRGVDVAPRQWERMLAERSKDAILLDVRNAYEWDLGRFLGARRPPANTFGQSDLCALGLDGVPKSTKIMMYCTGGIRCEFYSAMLLHEGFTDVCKLEGGVQNYGNIVGESQWQGKLFVFDRRNLIPLGEGKAEVVGRCKHCARPAEAVRNCANVDCNQIHISCDCCWCEHQGLCTPECAHGERVRPFEALQELTTAQQNACSPGLMHPEFSSLEPTSRVHNVSVEQGPLPGAIDINRWSSCVSWQGAKGANRT
jgi:UPF0176 protein